MSEFDYSNLYQNNTQGNQPSQDAAQQSEAMAQSSYPNVGSSGMNTANTAQTDYSSNAQQSNPQAGYNPQGNSQYDNGYSNHFSGNPSGNGGYSYSSAPQQPPKKKGSGKKVALRVAAAFGVVALGFGGGLAGSLLGSKLNGQGTVVVQQVERNDVATTAIAASGSGLTTAEVASLASPSVVAITTEQMVSSNTWFGGSYVQSGAGSGVIMSADGYIITCAHVVSGATTIKVTTSDGTEYDATLVGSDTEEDIAVLKIEATGLTPAVMGDSDALAVGEDAIAIGNPLGTLANSVSAGIVSAISREVEVDSTSTMTLIQIDTPVNPGNSGGGLFNANGELIGIVNLKSVASNTDDIGFAIPINDALDVAQQLIEKGHVSRPMLGVEVVTISDANTAMQYGVDDLGVYIGKVSDGGGAAKAGLQVADRIVAIDDVAVSQYSDIANYLDDKAIGDTVTLEIERDGKMMEFEVTLGESQES